MQIKDEKLEKFLQAINEYSQKQRAQILLDLEQQSSAELQRAETETLSDAYRMIQLRTADVRSRSKQDISRFEQESRRALLTKRAEIEEKVISEAADKLRAFVKTDGYAGYLSSCGRAAAKCFSASPANTVFFLLPEDKKYEGLIKSAFGFDCSFETDSSIGIGGLRAENKTLSAALDATLSSRLEQQREWLLEISGMELKD